MVSFKFLVLGYQRKAKSSYFKPLLIQGFFTDFSTASEPRQDTDQVGRPGDVSSRAQGSNHGHQRQAFAKGSDS